ncbi:hypothetical protein NB311A_01719 [Nitrobacter sp. Nb-311A]|nr:hypothetical protein NB311A_01719 [Nitrobacter sp. Nb-311A]
MKKQALLILVAILNSIFILDRAADDACSDLQKAIAAG